ncbi:lytic transglycosylase domain-containing protein [Thalassobaculum salexigens]|uniref:lytic transglycosylase domain-containing protein n=1 Tax=Thalassobaculum salexigens TaxID=455360 RepID=UPI000687ADFF|nr:lytic transglycosylase domain-containing protein [Thalassobaculum salexigens]
MKSIVLVLAVCAVVAIGTAPAAARSEAASREEVRRMVVQEAQRSARVPASLALAVAEAESDFVADAVSSAGARGVMQIMPATARGEFGVAAEDLWNPRLNIQLGVAFLQSLIERYDGRWDLALSHYNGGSRVGSGRAARVIPATRAYVDKVLAAERRYARDATAIALADRVAEATAGLERRATRQAEAARIERPDADRSDLRRRFMVLADAALAAAGGRDRQRGDAIGAGALLDRIADRKARFRVLLGDG